MQKESCVRKQTGCGKVGRIGRGAVGRCSTALERISAKFAGVHIVDYQQLTENYEKSSLT